MEHFLERNCALDQRPIRHRFATATFLSIESERPVESNAAGYTACTILLRTRASGQSELSLPTTLTQQIYGTKGPTVTGISATQSLLGIHRGRPRQSAEDRGLRPPSTGLCLCRICVIGKIAFPQTLRF